MASFDFGIKDLPGQLDLVDKRLKELAPRHIRGVERLLSSSGKRLRPSLVIAAAHYGGRDIDDTVIDAAAAIEFVHLASLVHDDIIDGGTLRWGVPTINAQEGIESAVLGGDWLLAQGCALAAGVNAEAVRVLAETIAVLCEGQAIELKDRFDTKRTAESLISAIKGKTSSMFAASLSLGGLAAGLQPSQLDLLSEFGENFGIAFQYIDDIKDFTSSAESAGKSVGNDTREGNYTLPVIFSLQGPNGDSLAGLLGRDPIPVPQVLEILEKDGSIARATEEAESYAQKALALAGKLDNTDFAAALKSFVETFGRV